MYENEIIEMEDFSFNHYLHHFDEYEDESVGYDVAFDYTEFSGDVLEPIS